MSHGNRPRPMFPQPRGLACIVRARCRVSGASPVVELAGLEYVTVGTVVAGELQLGPTSGHSCPLLQVFGKDVSLW